MDNYHCDYVDHALSLDVILLKFSCRMQRERLKIGTYGRVQTNIATAVEPNANDERTCSENAPLA
jgi:hypothetical protein